MKYLSAAHPPWRWPEKEQGQMPNIPGCQTWQQWHWSVVKSKGSLDYVNSSKSVIWNFYRRSLSKATVQGLLAGCKREGADISHSCKRDGKTQWGEWPGLPRPWQPAHPKLRGHSREMSPNTRHSLGSVAGGAKWSPAARYPVHIEQGSHDEKFLSFSYDWQEKE